MLGDSSYQTLFETSPPDSLYGKMWKTKFRDKERLLSLLLLLLDSLYGKMGKTKFRDRESWIQIPQL